MFRPLTCSSSGWWKQEHKYNYVSRSLKNLKIIQLVVKIKAWKIKSNCVQYNIWEVKNYCLKYGFVEWCTGQCRDYNIGHQSGSKFSTCIFTVHHSTNPRSKNNFYILIIYNHKSNPITGLVRSWGFQEVEVPRFQDNRHMKVARLSALSTGRFLPPGNIPGTHFC